jgi:hypothetical protein
MGPVSHCVINPEPDRAGAEGAELIVKVTALLDKLEHVPFEYCA